MKKLEDYKGKKIAIHFPTYELWLRRREINPSDKVLDEVWSRYKENSCYFIDLSKNGDYDSLNYGKSIGYTILPATEFLEEEFIYGQEYEFSDCEDFKNSSIQIFGCMYPNNCDHDYKYLAFDNKGYSTGWNYARKINTDRIEAITI